MNQHHYQAVLFDLDGTLIDTAPDFIRIIKELCQKHHHHCPDDTAIREQVSAGAKAMVKLIFGEELANRSDNDPLLLSYRQEFLDNYETNICIDSCLFSGFNEFLHTLEQHHIPWGIVTNKPRYLAVQLLEKMALDKRCSILVCPDDVKQTKPNPEPLFLASSSLDILPSKCIYVGDHIRDIEAGKQAGMHTIIAAYGYIPPEDKDDLMAWEADDIAYSSTELITQLTHLLLQ